MGEYRNGKWVPTFGDDQFGVVDDPSMKAQNEAQQEAEKWYTGEANVDRQRDQDIRMACFDLVTRTASISSSVSTASSCNVLAQAKELYEWVKTGK